jgi:V8-like Glu-specific endopeptidase
MTIHMRLDKESTAALEESMRFSAPRWHGPTVPFALPGRPHQPPFERYGAAAPHPAARFDDERVIGTREFHRVLNTTHEPFRNVCKIEDTDGTHLGSGTLIRGNRVLTAAHNVNTRRSTPARIRVVPAQREAGTGRTARPFGTAGVTRVNIPATYRALDVFENDDFAVLCLDRDFGHFWRRVRALDPARVRSATVNIAGYPNDPGGGDQMIRSYGRVLNVAPPLIEYDNDTNPGHSGSPIWLRWQETRTLIGVHQIADDGIAPEANRGIFFTDAILTQIQAWL